MFDIGLGCMSGSYNETTHEHFQPFAGLTFSMVNHRQDGKAYEGS
jgi:hypothetical protein